MILGIESTAHTFGLALVDKGKVLVNIKSSYTTEKGGIVPLEAAKHHEQVKESLYNELLEKSGISETLLVSDDAQKSDSKKISDIKENQIKAIAFSQGPGIQPCLLTGIKFAKSLARKLNVPLIPVNHCIAHLEIGKLTGCKDPVLLYCSGANTQIISYTSETLPVSDSAQKSDSKKISDTSGKYRIFGETLDVGVGNFIDTFARYAGLGFPGGPKIGELASKSNNYIELPYSIKGMDVAFSGILTNLKQKLESNKYKLEDLSFSLQETTFAMLIEAAERALAHLNKKELLLGGGVACNKRLQEMCKIMCKERGAKLFVPENQFLVDNAGMIAYLGEIMFEKGIFEKDLDKLDIKPHQRTDQVIVSWK